MLRIGICDDEIATCAELEMMILEIQRETGIQLSVDVWYTGAAFLKDNQQKHTIDLLFLDIELPDTDGINIGKEIRRNRDYNMLIAYISSKRHYVMELFQNQPIAFLVKPIKKEEVLKTIQDGYQCMKDKRTLFEYKKERASFFLACDDILYFASSLKKIEIIKTDGGKDEFYGKLSEVYKRLPEYFSCIHKSFIINRHYVKRYSYEELQMMNDELLPISKVHRNELRDQMCSDRERR